MTTPTKTPAEVMQMCRDFLTTLSGEYTVTEWRKQYGVTEYGYYDVAKSFATHALAALEQLATENDRLTTFAAVEYNRGRNDELASLRSPKSPEGLRKAVGNLVVSKMVTDAVLLAIQPYLSGVVLGEDDRSVLELFIKQAELDEVWPDTVAFCRRILSASPAPATMRKPARQICNHCMSKGCDKCEEYPTATMPQEAVEALSELFTLIHPQDVSWGDIYTTNREDEIGQWYEGRKGPVVSLDVLHRAIGRLHILSKSPVVPATENATPRSAQVSGLLVGSGGVLSHAPRRSPRG